LAERPSPIFAVLGVVAILAGAGAAGWIIWDQNQPRVEAPTEPQVCFRMDRVGGQARFTVIDKPIENLESCAAQLEGIHMETGANLIGAFQGRFIFVDRNAIQSAQSLDGARWRIFWGAQREALGKKIRAARERQLLGLPPLQPPP